VKLLRTHAEKEKHDEHSVEQVAQTPEAPWRRPERRIEQDNVVLKQKAGIGSEKPVFGAWIAGIRPPK
jgi:hypothetical protein